VFGLAKGQKDFGPSTAVKLNFPRHREGKVKSGGGGGSTPKKTVVQRGGAKQKKTGSAMSGMGFGGAVTGGSGQVFLLGSGKGQKLPLLFVRPAFLLRPTPTKGGGRHTIFQKNEIKRGTRPPAPHRYNSGFPMFGPKGPGFGGPKRGPGQGKVGTRGATCHPRTQSIFGFFFPGGGDTKPGRPKSGGWGRGGRRRGNTQGQKIGGGGGGRPCGPPVWVHFSMIFQGFRGQFQKL